MRREAWLEDGAMCSVQKGVLTVSGVPVQGNPEEDIYVGRPEVMCDDQGNLVRAPCVPNVIMPVFEIACNPTAYGVPSEAVLERLRENGVKAVNRGIDRKVREAEEIARVGDVWVIYRDGPTVINVDSGGAMGVLAYAQIAVFGTSLCLQVRDERPRRDGRP